MKRGAYSIDGVVAPGGLEVRAKRVVIAGRIIGRVNVYADTVEVKKTCDYSEGTIDCIFIKIEEGANLEGVTINQRTSRN
ncbi:MAG: hypothetical protein CMH62_00385 [Nanoarchaeota archaeon]|nr:hypothetical protein [Nanoarchaeota archaeon]|tara:strand:- start:878 stop:1117 length:240 start_codon:yes stop_codon:yes gene_type:complete